MHAIVFLITQSTNFLVPTISKLKLNRFLWLLIIIKNKPSGLAILQVLFAKKESSQFHNNKNAINAKTKYQKKNANLRNIYIFFFFQIFGHISGSHLNPVVTLGAVILELMDYITAAYYVVGQFAGAILGFGLIKLLTPSRYNSYTEVFDKLTNSTIRTPGLCTTLPHEEISAMQVSSHIYTLFYLFIQLVC